MLTTVEKPNSGPARVSPNFPHQTSGIGQTKAGVINLTKPRKILIYLLIGLTALFFITGLLLRKDQDHTRPAPSRTVPRQYAYYRIVEEKTGKLLMTVSSAPVTKGDELITDDNKHYVVVKVEKNVAYARYMETVQFMD